MRHAWLLVLCLAATALADGPSSRPAADDDVDFLLAKARPAAPAAPPSTSSTSQPPASQPSPFAPRQDADTRPGTITLSNGEKIHGMLAHTADKPVRVWIEQKQEYRDIPYALIASFEARVTNEYDEPEWHFKETGSDIKEFTGKTYPVRETQYTLTLKDASAVTGGVVEPIYLQRREGPYTFSLLKRDKGEVGKTLKDLVYIRRIDFDDAAKPAKANLGPGTK